LHDFDRPEALDRVRLVEDLTALRAGRPARLPRYDFATHTRSSEEDEISPRPVIVLEGHLILALEPIRSLVDHRIYLEAPEPVRVARRVAGDLAETGRTRGDVLAQFERTVRPAHARWVVPSRAHADLVLDGEAPLEDLVSAALGAIGPG